MILYYLIKIMGSSLQFEGIRSAQIEEPTLFHQNQNKKKIKKITHKYLICTLFTYQRNKCTHFCDVVTCYII